MSRRSPLLGFTACMLLAGCPTEPVPASDPATPATATDTSGRISFREQVLPIFEVHCVSCHTPPNAQGGLDLTDPTGAGLFSNEVACLQGPADVVQLPPVIPFDGAASPLVLKVSDQSFQLTCGREMPATGRPLIVDDPEAVEVLRTWIDEGAEID